MVVVFILVFLGISVFFVVIVFCIGEFENKCMGLWRSRWFLVVVEYDNIDFEKEISKYNKF